MKPFILRLVLVVAVSIAAAWYAATAWNSYKFRREMARAEATEKADNERAAQILQELAGLVAECDEVAVNHQDDKMREVRSGDKDWIKSLVTILKHASGRTLESLPRDGILMVVFPHSYVCLYREKQSVLFLETRGGSVSCIADKRSVVVLDKDSAASIYALIAAWVEDGARVLGDGPVH